MMIAQGGSMKAFQWGLQDYYNNKAYWQCAAAHLPSPANGTGTGLIPDMSEAIVSTLLLCG